MSSDRNYDFHQNLISNREHSLKCPFVKVSHDHSYCTYEYKKEKGTDEDEDGPPGSENKIVGALKEIKGNIHKFAKMKEFGELTTAIIKHKFNEEGNTVKFRTKGQVIIIVFFKLCCSNILYGKNYAHLMSVSCIWNELIVQL